MTYGDGEVTSGPRVGGYNGRICRGVPNLLSLALAPSQRIHGPDGEFSNAG